MYIKSLGLTIVKKQTHGAYSQNNYMQKKKILKKSYDKNRRRDKRRVASIDQIYSNNVADDNIIINNS